ncbi:MAG TPA: TetR/AcrR family transcriptional regulator [Chitinophagaceae bacterium]|nr:TetR/AcrR family transcriptional regulator [Chitinophagaceae bacterium]
MTDKKAHILDVAMQLFAEKGFEGSSIRDLAARAGVNVAMVNYYFGSKEKLFESLVAQKASYTRGVLDEIVKNTALSDIEKIDAVIDTYVDRLFTNRVFHRVIHQELMLSQRESLQQSIADIIFPNSLLIKEILEEGTRKGNFKQVDPPLVIATLVGTINQVLLSRKMCNKLLNKEASYIPYDDEQFVQRVRRHIKQLMRDHLLP